MKSHEVANAGKQIGHVAWPADDDNGGYYKSELLFYRVGDEFWVVGKTSLGTSENARLHGEPVFTGVVPGEECNALGADDAGVFSDVVELVATVPADEATYEFQY